jgi:acyl carrier protein
MNSMADFLTLVETELGLPVTAEAAVRGFDELDGWDSVQLLSLISAVERQTGRSIPLADALEASSLRDVYALVAEAA